MNTTPCTISAELLRTYIEQLLDSFKEGICITDAHGTILYLNKAYVSISDIPQEQMLYRNVNDLVHQELLDTVLNPEVFLTKQPASRVQQVANGRKLLLEGSPVFDAQGRVVMCMTLVRDVTLLTEMQEQFALQKELLDTLQQIQTVNGSGEAFWAKPVVAHSAVMRTLHRELYSVASTDATVLLLGETGVGKEVSARRLHALSNRKHHAFIKIDCGSIPEHLIETELFGYVAGTFSGGNKNGKIGLFEAAEGGTLFLDELAELPLSMQTRLLRFLQDREVVRVGSTQAQKVNVRIIAATNKDLEKAVKNGEFRSDLYYRIHVLTFRVPPLRERKSDIIPLSLAFLTYYNGKFRKKVDFSSEAQQAMLSYAWPGNARELENVVQRAVLMSAHGVITCRELTIPPAQKREAPEKDADFYFDISGKTYTEIMDRVEQTLFNAALAKYGTIAEAAKVFGVAKSTISRKIQKLERAAPTKPKVGRKRC